MPAPTDTSRRSPSLIRRAFNRLRRECGFFGTQGSSSESAKLGKIEGGEQASASSGIEEGSEEGYERYDPSQILIKYRADAQGESMDLPHDFDHIPTADELQETFGPWYYLIYTKIGEENTIVSKLIHNPPKVDEYQVYN
ncbi:MAG: hypothetical protein EFT35_06695 [Methanophagales archaeon ANME-1-THS]|nr:MAG: hypothetical protein EFT35_06695 [Methanophagales archaeon ANME-1-THS]